jgi:hypothetical protein
VFSISLNFPLPERLVAIINRFGAVYNQREWHMELFKYKEIAIEIS